MFRGRRPHQDCRDRCRPDVHGKARGLIEPGRGVGLQHPVFLVDPEHATRRKVGVLRLNPLRAEIQFNDNPVPRLRKVRGVKRAHPIGQDCRSRAIIQRFNEATGARGDNHRGAVQGRQGKAVGLCKGRIVAEYTHRATLVDLATDGKGHRCPPGPEGESRKASGACPEFKYESIDLYRVAVGKKEEAKGTRNRGDAKPVAGWLVVPGQKA